jgi:dihydroorotate dehydrogenase (fumarate)
MVDLTTNYLGLHLKNPLVASASPLSKKVDSSIRMEQAGVSAIVMYSLFEEQIIRESLKLHADLTRGTESFAEALTYLPDYGMYSIGPEKYLEVLEKTKRAVSIPVIGSLNGTTPGGWTEYAKKIEQTGADALELNMYDLATDPEISAAQLEDRYLSLVGEIRKDVRLPLAVKLSPFFTSLPNFAKRLVEAGVNGLVLFNRFYQPDFDLEELEVTPNLLLSTSVELRLPLRWIAILHGRMHTDFALTSGIHTPEDVIKSIMAGASVVMSASALLHEGIQYAPVILDGIQSWMVEHEYESIQQMKGSMSQQAVADPSTFERVNYIAVLNSY